MTTKVGFVGTGTITEAVVTGLCLDNPLDLLITVSPRNEAKAKKLQARFKQVSIAASNQEVLDQCDLVCIAVTPQNAEAVLSPLTFREEQTIVSFMAPIPLAEVHNLVAPAKAVCKAIPMPPIARRSGPVPLLPPNPKVKALFSRAVTVVELKKESELDALTSVSGMMAPFYQLLSTTQKWVVAQGVESEAASSFVGELFHSLADDAKDLQEGFEEITRASQTPGGINEQALRDLSNAGFYKTYEEELETIMNRVSKANN